MTIIAQGCFDWLLDAFDPYWAAEDDGAGHEAAEQPEAAPDTVEGLESLLQAAGFQQVEVSEESAEFVYPGEAAWWATLWTLGFRSTLEKMSPPTLESFRLEIFHRLQPFKSPDGIHLLFRVLFACGIK